MTPAPIDLPLRPSEAAALAELIFDQVGGRKLTDDIRGRLSGRAAAQGFKTIAPYFGSLDADPIHPGTYHLAIDGLAGDQSVPLLLHMTPAASPGGGLFPKPLLIGRMRPAAGREIVINATRFGPGDTEAIAAYAGEVSRSFLPRARGALPQIWVDTGGDAQAAVEALLAFRTILRTNGPNLAGLHTRAGAAGFWPMVWAAIRAGCRDGYSVSGANDKECARWLSCFRVLPEEALDAVHTLRSLRAGVPFDLELDAREHSPANALEALRAAGVTPQFVLTKSGDVPHGSVPSLELTAESEEQLRAARQRVHGSCAVTVRWNGKGPAAALLLDALR